MKWKWSSADFPATESVVYAENMEPWRARLLRGDNIGLSGYEERRGYKRREGTIRVLAKRPRQCIYNRREERL